MQFSLSHYSTYIYEVDITRIPHSGVHLLFPEDLAMNGLCLSTLSFASTHFQPVFLKSMQHCSLCLFNTKFCTHLTKYSKCLTLFAFLSQTSGACDMYRNKFIQENISHTYLVNIQSKCQCVQFFLYHIEPKISDILCFNPPPVAILWMVWM